MSKSRQTSTVITVAGTHLDGYSGRFDVITLRKQPLHRRVLRLPQRVNRQMVYGNAKGDGVRIWRYR